MDYLRQYEQSPEAFDELMRELAGQSAAPMPQSQPPAARPAPAAPPPSPADQFYANLYQQFSPQPAPPPQQVDRALMQQAIEQGDSAARLQKFFTIFNSIRGKQIPDFSAVERARLAPLERLKKLHQIQTGQFGSPGAQAGTGDRQKMLMKLLEADPNSPWNKQRREQEQAQQAAEREWWQRQQQYKADVDVSKAERMQQMQERLAALQGGIRPPGFAQGTTEPVDPNAAIRSSLEDRAIRQGLLPDDPSLDTDQQHRLRKRVQLVDRQGGGKVAGELHKEINKELDDYEKMVVAPMTKLQDDLRQKRWSDLDSVLNMIQRQMSKLGVSQKGDVPGIGTDAAIAEGLNALTGPLMLGQKTLDKDALQLRDQVRLLKDIWGRVQTGMRISGMEEEYFDVASGFLPTASDEEFRTALKILRELTDENIATIRGGYSAEVNRLYDQNRKLQRRRQFDVKRERETREVVDVRADEKRREYIIQYSDGSVEVKPMEEVQ